MNVNKENYFTKEAILTLWQNVTLTSALTVGSNTTMNIPEGVTLDIGEGGSIVNNGIVNDYEKARNLLVILGEAKDYKYDTAKTEIEITTAKVCPYTYFFTDIDIAEVGAELSIVTTYNASNYGINYKNVKNDLARFLAAIYRSRSSFFNEIEFNGAIYEWRSACGLQASNWCLKNEIETNHTLMSDISAVINTNGLQTIKLVINGVTVTYGFKSGEIKSKDDIKTILLSVNDTGSFISREVSEREASGELLITTKYTQEKINEGTASDPQFDNFKTDLDGLLGAIKNSVSSIKFACNTYKWMDSEELGEGNWYKVKGNNEFTDEKLSDAIIRVGNNLEDIPVMLDDVVVTFKFEKAESADAVL